MRLDVHVYHLHPKVGVLLSYLSVRMNIQSYLSLKMTSLKVDTLPPLLHLNVICLLWRTRTSYSTLPCIDSTGAACLVHTAADDHFDDLDIEDVKLS